jgi:hypothetical protein
MRTHTHSQICFWIVGFEVLTVVGMKSSVFWVITPCSSLAFNGLCSDIFQKIELLYAIVPFELIV